MINCGEGENFCKKFSPSPAFATKSVAMFCLQNSPHSLLCRPLSLSRTFKKRYFLLVCISLRAILGIFLILKQESYKNLSAKQNSKINQHLNCPKRGFSFQMIRGHFHIYKAKKGKRKARQHPSIKRRYGN